MVVPLCITPWLPSLGLSGLSGRVNSYELNEYEQGIRQTDFSLAKNTVAQVHGSSEHTADKQKCFFNGLVNKVQAQTHLCRREIILTFHTSGTKELWEHWQTQTKNACNSSKYLHMNFAQYKVFDRIFMSGNLPRQYAVYQFLQQCRHIGSQHNTGCKGKYIGHVRFAFIVFCSLTAKKKYYA